MLAKKTTPLPARPTPLAAQTSSCSVRQRGRRAISRHGAPGVCGSLPHSHRARHSPPVRPPPGGSDKLVFCAPEGEEGGLAQVLRECATHVYLALPEPQPAELQGLQFVEADEDARPVATFKVRARARWVSCLFGSGHPTPTHTYTHARVHVFYMSGMHIHTHKHARTHSNTYTFTLTQQHTHSNKHTHAHTRRKAALCPTAPSASSLDAGHARCLAPFLRASTTRGLCLTVSEACRHLGFHAGRGGDEGCGA